MTPPVPVIVESMVPSSSAFNSAPVPMSSAPPVMMYSSLMNCICWTDCVPLTVTVPEMPPNTAAPSSQAELVLPAEFVQLVVPVAQVPSPPCTVPSAVVHGVVPKLQADRVHGELHLTACAVVDREIVAARNDAQRQALIDERAAVGEEGIGTGAPKFVDFVRFRTPSSVRSVSTATRSFTPPAHDARRVEFRS